jgi:hypothetical protein
MIFKNPSASARKKVKDRITVLLTCNMVGTIKTKQSVIGKSKSPRCFKGLKDLPVEYVHNANAWITASISEYYFRNWDRKLNKKKKKIVLILDNSLAHPKLNFKSTELTIFPSRHYVAHSTSRSENYKNFQDLLYIGHDTKNYPIYTRWMNWELHPTSPNRYRF